ncbi:MAG: phosphoglycerate dehydrogenase [Gammaproteobacteria bacterium]|nr:phosphoglycerate dehydrogenase [Gammaproteobacteria bacterium]
MFRILVSDKLGPAGLDRLAEAQDAEFDVRTDMSKQELCSVIANYDALLVRSSTQVDNDVLTAGKRLRVVGRAGMGVDNIDIKAATASGVIVMNTPGANSIATAEHTLTMLLAACRHTAQAHTSVQNGQWERYRFVGIQLYRKTLGLIGFGRIARHVAKRAKAFDMEVIAYDPYVSEEIGQQAAVTLVDRDELFAQADVISLHSSLSAETEHIVNTANLAKAKDGVIVINPSRGGLVDEQALATALKDGRVRCAALDVYSEEPPGADNPLIGLPNVLTTPHLGASTEEAQRDVAVLIVEQVLDALRNEDFRNSVNMPFAAGPEFASVLPYMQLGERIGILQFHMADAPIRKVELELHGDTVREFTKPIATGVLKGLMSNVIAEPVNYINAPMLAEQHGIHIAQAKGLVGPEYTNVMSCRVSWEGGERIVTGAVFGGEHPRILQVSDYHLDVDPSGTVLVMLNNDVPGVIGQVGTLLGAYGVNIGEWRLGRPHAGGDALSFINLDSEPPAGAIDALEQVEAIKKLRLVHL